MKYKALVSRKQWKEIEIETDTLGADEVYGIVEQCWDEDREVHLAEVSENRLEDEVVVEVFRTVRDW